MNTTPTISVPSKAVNTRSKVALGVGTVLAVGAIAFGGTVVTGAFFTSEATVNQSVATGTVEIEAGTSATSAPLSIVDLLPGDVVSTDIELQNTGNTGVYYRISLPREFGGSDALAEALQVTVAAGATTTTQSLDDWQDGYLQVGTALAGETDQDVTVSVSLAETADDSLQGSLAAFAVQFEAIQERNVDAPVAGWTLLD